MRLTWFSLMLVAVVAAVGDRNYHDYQVVEIPRDLVDSRMFELLQSEYDVWAVTDKVIQVMTPQNALDNVFPQAELVIRDVATYLEENVYHRVSSLSNEYFEEYHSLNDSLTWFQEMAASYPQLTRYVPDIGSTWEGRRMSAMHVTAATTSVPQIWIQACIHAREWISPAVQQYFYNHLLTNYGVDSEVTQLLQQVEFIFIPYVNPDGHSYTWTNDRMWRKNRRNNNGSYGVDLNRNYDKEWGGEGSSGVPSSETYRGPSAASEPETQNLSKYFNQQSNIIGAIDLHSYSQFVLWPWSYTRTATEHGSQFTSLSSDLISIIQSVHGTRFTGGQWYDHLYPSSGVSMDWYYDQTFSGRHPYAITIELRPNTSVPGFLLPPEEIIPSGEEMTPALMHFAWTCLNDPLL